jgi:transposase
LPVKPLMNAIGMDTNPLFSAALGLTPPWMVVETRFDASAHRLDLRLDFPAGSRFPCPECGSCTCPVHDTSEKTWRHQDFWQHRTFLTARVPRVRCDRCGTRQVSVPWARPGSGFTLLLEALILELAKSMPVLPIARLLGVDDKTVWRVLEHYLGEAIRRIDASSVAQVGIDETSARKRHDYVTLFYDLDQRRLLEVADGKDHRTIAQFARFLDQHGGSPEAVREVSCDLSPAFQKGIREHLPQASVTFDRFHIAKILGDALDQVRRSEWRQDKAIKGTRYLVLKNPDRLTAKQRDLLDEALARNANLAEAYRLKETFRDLYRQPDWQAGRGFLKAWITMARNSGLAPMRKAAQTIAHHWQGILRWFSTGLNNGIMEGLNSLIQAAKRKARGYRNHATFRLIAYLIAGRLDLRIRSGT